MTSVVIFNTVEAYDQANAALLEASRLLAEKDESYFAQHGQPVPPGWKHRKAAIETATSYAPKTPKETIDGRYAMVLSPAYGLLLAAPLSFLEGLLGHSDFELVTLDYYQDNLKPQDNDFA